MEEDYNECPECGSSKKEFIDDNLDLLFDYGFDLPFEFIRTWECADCGATYDTVILFRFEDQGVRYEG